ncbi:flavin prenyltransferase UbiX [Thiolapillus sp.]
MSSRPIAVAFTGASGIAYGLRLVECLLEAGRDVQLLYSRAAQVVARMELEMELPSSAEQAGVLLRERFGVTEERLQVFGRQQWTAPVASGSNPPDALVVCPCTTGTLASIAHGISDDLIDRAADVMLKERRRLILVVRETPFSAIHLENMLAVTRAGGVVMPANPGFYYRPEKVEDLVDFMVARVLDHLEVAHDLLPRWGAGRL